MSEILKFENKNEIPKTRDDLDLKNVTLLDKDNEVLDDKIKEEYLNKIYSNTEHKDCDENLLFSFRFEDIESFLEKNDRTINVLSFKAESGEDMGKVIETIPSVNFLCLVEARPDGDINDLLFLNKPFMQNMCIAVRLSPEQKENYNITLFYTPMQKHKNG